jgi:hypothetical protein
LDSKLSGGFVMAEVQLPSWTRYECGNVFVLVATEHEHGEVAVIESSIFVCTLLDISFVWNVVML